MTSDRLTDSLDRQWVPGTVLGRGTWGRSRIIASLGQAQIREAVLKEPLTDADFPADASLPDDLLPACRACARQQADLLQQGAHPWLPRLEATIDLGGGRVGLVLPEYQTLEQRLRNGGGIAGGGIALGEVLKLVHRIAQTLAESGMVHGNLRPSNILFGERGGPLLADPVTPALAAHHVRLMAAAGARGWLPPEARVKPATPPNSRLPSKPATAIWARWDTWALCQIIHCAILADPYSDVPSELQLAEDGLDKVALSSLKDAAHAKLGAEGSNPRFRGRVTDRLGALLARGLSAEHEPSPPYRFATARDLAERVNEVLALLRPRVVEVGKILLPPQASDGVFQHGADVGFTVTVGCTLGITDHEDLVCGLQLVDLDATDDARKPVEDAKLAVQVHPSGRLRFQLTLPDVPPGRYRVRVAFAVKDSGDEPQVANGDFEVRPAPGYVPPRPAPAPAAPLEFRAQGRAAPTPTSPGRSASAPPPVLRPAGAAVSDPRTPVPRGRTSNPERGSEASGTPTSAERTAGRSGEAVGMFPRPVAPPEEDDDTPRAPIKAASPMGAAPRISPITLRPAEPMTDATQPAPNHWPPVASPPNPHPTRTGLEEPNGPIDGEELLEEDTDPWARGSRRGTPGGGPVAATPSREGGGPRTAVPEPGGSGAGAGTGGPRIQDRGPWPVRDPARDANPWAQNRGAWEVGSSGAGSQSGTSPRIRPEFDLPVGGEDLPGFGAGPGTRGSGLLDDRGSELGRIHHGRQPGLLERIVDLVRRDSYVAVGAAVAACLVIVLLSSAALRACE